MVLSVSLDDNRAPKSATLIELGSCESIDLSTDFAAAFADPQYTDVHPIWTADGKYLMVNTSRRGGCLVQPRPWSVIPIGERLVDYLGGRFPDNELPSESDPRPPTIHPFPIAGWVEVLARGREYAVDYEVERVVRLDGSAWPTGGADSVVSPQGDRCFKFAGYLRRIKATAIDLSAAKALVIEVE